MRAFWIAVSSVVPLCGVHAAVFNVTSAADSGAGSLRQAFADAAVSPGADEITFDAGLDGMSIILASEIQIADVDALTVDGSALDASSGSAATGGQRGFPIAGTADIGAYEAGTVTGNYHAWIHETLPNTAGIGEAAFGGDHDGDGWSNGDEFGFLSDPLDPLSFPGSVR
ncbi:MAG: hypothetical protein Q7R22_009020 [Verrucomicrobiota bacterium JB025]|nr:hypothetical protein [Verrucomicrobiota bacterium JB025]